eukprot:278037-Rhodomonas_salina.1
MPLIRRGLPTSASSLEAWGSDSSPEQLFADADGDCAPLHPLPCPPSLRTADILHEVEEEQTILPPPPQDLDFIEESCEETPASAAAEAVEGSERVSSGAHGEGAAHAGESVAVKVEEARDASAREAEVVRDLSEREASGGEGGGASGCGGEAELLASGLEEDGEQEKQKGDGVSAGAGANGGQTGSAER